MSASYRHCFESASAAAGRELSDDELDRLFTALQGRMGRYVREGTSPREAAMRAGREQAEEHRAAAAVQRRTDLLNLQKRVATRQWIADAAEGPLGRKGGEAGLDRAVRAKLDGSGGVKIDGGGASTQAVGRAQTARYFSMLASGLEKLGLRDAARAGTLDKPIRQEMFELSNTATGKPGVSGDKHALEIAKLFGGSLAATRDRLNAQGAWIGHLTDFIMHTSHDPLRIFRAGFKTWRDFTLPLLDTDRTFEGVTDPQAFLRSVQANLATGVHIGPEGALGFKDPAFRGPGNLAKRLSQSRLLHFKDADSWGAYMDRFGTPGTMTEHVLATLRRGAEQEALMRQWGTNPRAEFENTLQWLGEKCKGSDQAAVRRLDDKRQGLLNIFGQLDGELKRPANEWGARFGQGLRNLEVMSKLGNVLLSHLGSVVTSARELQRNGENLFESYLNPIRSFLGRYQGEDARVMHEALAAGMESAHASLAVPGWVDDSVPGTVSKITNKFMQATGLPFTLDWKKAGVTGALSRILGGQIGKDFADLRPETQTALTQYAISPAEWDAVRGVADHYKTSAGKALLLPDAALRSGLDPKAADDLALKLATYYSDAGNRATITPGAAERAMIFRGTRPGTPEGELLRFIAQFKTWPLAMARGLAYEKRYGMGHGGAIGGVLQLAAGMTVLGYLRNAVADMAQGKQPRDPRDKRTWEAAFAQGGGAGIFGDYLFGQTNRFGEGVAETIAGPVLGEGTNNLMTIYNDMRDYVFGDGTKLKEAGDTVIHAGLRNTPFINLFYARAALNYLFLSSIMESMNPGYLRRSERSLKTHSGQSFLSPRAPLVGWMNPTNHLHTFGR